MFLCSWYFQKFLYTYFNIGIAKADKGDNVGAISEYSKAIDIDPKFAIAYFYRGLVKLKLKQKNKACLDFSKAGELGYEMAYETINKSCN